LAMPDPHTDYIRALAAHRDIVFSVGDDRTIVATDVHRRRVVIREPEAHREAIHAVHATMVDGRVMLVTGGADGSLKFWEVGSTLKSYASIELDAPVTSLAGVDDTVIIGTMAGVVAIEMTPG